jgi:hypothetical protein
VQVRSGELPLAPSAGLHVSVVEIAQVVCASVMELEPMDSLPLPICPLLYAAAGARDGFPILESVRSGKWYLCGRVHG